MDFISIRIITDDVTRLVEFYQHVTGEQPIWATEDFAEIRTDHATLAIAGTRTIAPFAPGSARSSANHSVIIDFLVDDVDGVHSNLTGNLTGIVADVVYEPTTMPWGNRSLLLRDPDGNLVNIFTPVTPAAMARFGR
jgi:predicted enzyme related to lactoylglutathione lyase